MKLADDVDLEQVCAAPALLSVLIADGKPPSSDLETRCMYLERKGCAGHKWFLLF
jgi:hypothetical protein